ncbi:MAG: 30S ribosome-binding factor RbfA [Sphingomonadaceae bacterium]|nr:30S ribosome-binding factor RbfA [Sphingomonadaceae bacterium]
MPPAPKPSVRLLRVGEEMRHAVAEVLARGAVEGLPVSGGLISVTEVRLTPDLKIATVFVRALGVEDHRPLIRALAGQAGTVRREIARRVNLRFTPELRFRVDESFDTGARVDAILRRPEVARDLSGPGSSEPGESA